MDVNLDALEVTKNESERRFQIDMPDGSIAMVEYQLNGNNIIYTHTEVPPQWEGNGVAGKLAHHVMEYAQAQGHKVQALCPYIKHYVQEHEEYQPITWGFNKPKQDR